MTNYTLPDKLSDLLELAINDLIAVEKVVEKNPNLHIEMSTWHSLDTKNHCFMCLAGCVMRQELGIGDDEDSMPDDFPIDIGHKLEILDYLRVGNICDALDVMDINFSVEDIRELDCSIVNYEKQPKLFKTQLTELVTKLREKGL